MNAYPTHASRRRAFTIIELLVVIAIVAVLAAILFPVFAHARQSARQTQCLSNLRSLGLAVQLYASEDDDAYLARTDAFGEENPGYEARASQFSWLVALMPYARDAALARCPTAVDGARVFALSDGRRRYDLPEKHLGVNGFLAVNFLIDPKASVVKTTEVGRPAELPLLADSAYVAFGHPDYVIQANYDANPTDSESLLTDPKRPQNRIDPRLSRHAGGSNVLYCDLHARRRAQAAMGLDPARASLPDAQRFLLPVDPADDRVR